MNFPSGTSEELSENENFVIFFITRRSIDDNGMEAKRGWVGVKYLPIFAEIQFVNILKTILERRENCFLAELLI